MKLTQALSILRARRWLVISVLFLTVGLALAASFLLPPRYVATVSLVVDTKSTDPVSGALMPVPLLPTYVATQVDVIASHNVALKVVDRLKLANLPEVRQQFVEATGGAGSVRDWAADQLLRQIDVRPSRESSVISIHYASSDPQSAADLANAFADAYIQASVELKTDPARRQSGWFEQQVSDLRKALEVAQDKLSAYQRDSGILGTETDRLDVENARLAELSSQLVAAQRAMYDAETRQKQMNSAAGRDRLDELPDIAGNALVQSLKAEIVRSEAKLAEISGRYDRNHPQYLSAAAELNSLKAKLAAELDTAKGSITQSAQIARRQVAEIEQALERQKARVLELTHQRDTLAVLTRDVESARAAYDAAMQRHTHVRLESRLDQTDIAVLNPAIPPLLPVFPKIPLNIALSVIVGLMFGAGLALALEMMNRRVRVRDDLAYAAGIPVLAEIPRMGNRRKHRAAADMPKKVVKLKSAPANGAAKAA
ncbi:MAG TPA: chain length determinant protein EpsF [Steroidobacteraceae bacterium]|nr:chain length determinant protein EpsF [Steroidobacteraceae bacterium]